MYLQIMDCRTMDREAMAALEEEWRAATEGSRTARRVLVARDCTDADHYLVMTFFDNAEDAKTQSDLVDTASIAVAQSAVIVELPTFLDLEVIKDIEY